MIETIIYYVFCAMCLVGALGVILLRSRVNAAMSMLVSMLGVAGLMLLMKAYFLAFIMMAVYAGAVLVLFVFIIMLVGDNGEPRTLKTNMSLMSVWVLLGLGVGLGIPELVENSPMGDGSALASAQNYGVGLFRDFMLAFEIAGALLLAAIVCIISIAKERSPRKRKSDML